MKILTLNTWNVQGPWRERTEVMSRFLDEAHPDIVGFQEVFDRSWAEEIQKSLGFSSIVFPPVFSGLTFVSRYPVRRSDCIEMKTQSPTEDYSRYVLFVEYQIGHQKLAAFNTHLSWKPDEGRIREAQVAELLDYINDRAGKLERVVMGDFNAPPDTPEIQKMVQRGQYIDTFAQMNPGVKGHTWDNRNLYASSSSMRLPDRRIDYIFIKNLIEMNRPLESVEIVLNRPNDRGVFGSDHYGVLATFS